ALSGIPRGDYRLVAMVGHDFTAGQRDGAKGYPRFTDPRLRGPVEYESYLRGAVEASLERCGAGHFDAVLLHNPDHIGYSSPAVWEEMESLRSAGLAGSIGVAPGLAHGITLGVIASLARFVGRIDRESLILHT